MQDLSACNSSFCDFERSYRQGQLPAVRELMSSVLGCDYGGTSWTTKSQAQRAVGLLNLGSNSRLLDVGAGTGWPGLFLARESRCNVTLVDLPLIALSQARIRARHDGLDGHCDAVVGSGTALPFADGSFDRLSHSDVLCCLHQKEQLLRECHRVASADAIMLFSVIYVSPNLNGDEHREAVRVGPPFVDASAEYPELLQAAGWNVGERIDVTGEYLGSLQKLVGHMSANAVALSGELGEAEFTGQVAHRREQIAANERGWLRREVIVSTSSRR